MTADGIVFAVVVIGSAFGFGLSVGEQSARDKITVTCAEQPGESLLSSYQDRDGVTCSYGRSYGIAIKKRKAVKS